MNKALFIFLVFTLATIANPSFAASANSNAGGMGASTEAIEQLRSELDELRAAVLSLNAKHTSVDCGEKTLQSEIDKLNKSTTNYLEIIGSCTEDVVIAGFTNLTLTGTDGASLTAASDSTIALRVDGSKVMVQSLIINGGYSSGWCGNRSICDFRDVTIHANLDGIIYTEQSKGNILGLTVIQGGGLDGQGLGIYQESSVNIRSDNDVLFTEEYGSAASISGFKGYWGFGVVVFDGSFLRADNATISENGTGIYAKGQAVIKFYGHMSEGGEINDGGIINNDYDGIFVSEMSWVHAAVPITDNGHSEEYIGSGVYVDSVSYYKGQSPGAPMANNAGGDVYCEDPTRNGNACSPPPN